MTALLVANDGGHLMQLHTLRPRLGVGDDAVWVTPRTPQTESLLAGERVFWAEPCPPRDVAALVRNTALCRSLFEEHRVSLALSTGAALALAVLPQARARGIRTVYIESATRQSSPSLSGRVLSMVPGVRTFSQSPALATRRWEYLASPWDLYRVSPCGPRPLRRVVVSLGTQEGFGFGRLVRRLVQLLPGDADVLWQTGSTDVSGLGIEGRAKVPSAEMGSAIAQADVVVAHAGTGIALQSLENGKFPVLVPRIARLGEHVDDHQLAIALDLSLRGLGLSRDADCLALDDLEFATTRRVEKVDAPAALDVVRVPRQRRQQIW